MKKPSNRKPLTLSTQTLKTLTDPDALVKVAGGYNYNGSENLGCYASALSICPLC